MNMVINPEFQFLEAFLKRLPECFYSEGETIYKARNEIKIFKVDGLVLNVKSYRKPIFFNRVVYTFFRRSKSRRAFDHALELAVRGFDTPKPVAYIEQRNGGLLDQSYFVSLQFPYTRMFREFADHSDVTGREDILEAFGFYVAALHQAGILHLDLSPGNILFEKEETGIHFCLVDINRMNFQTINQEVGCKNFERLRGNTAFFRILANSYAKACGYDADTCFERILYYNARSVKSFKRKDAFKKLRNK
ncbi:MAG: lipopolysaccharide kinase InaA family protein [Bacteroidales bacterium]|nr:lipopolysaccharide kinase InaA family protein [Bacteroidales bacterium]